MRQIRWMHLSGYLVLLVFPLLLIGMNLAYGGTVGGAVRSNAAIYVALALFWLVGVPLLTRWNAARMLRATPAFQGELEYAFAETGVEVKSAVSRSQFAWASFVKAIETKEFFLLFQNKHTASFLPKAAFGSAQERQSFQSLVSSQLGDRAIWLAGSRAAS